MPNVLNDTEKQVCLVLLEEYKRLNNEILKRLDFMDKNIYYQLIVLGATITGIINLWNSSNQLVQYILLISTFIFYALSAYYSINNLFILRIGIYINKKIRPKLTSMLNDYVLLEFDEFLHNKSIKQVKKKKLSKLIEIILLHWTLFIPSLLLFLYTYINFTEEFQNLQINLSELILFILNIIFYGLTLYPFI